MMGSTGFGPILAVLVALAACAPVTTGRSTVSVPELVPVTGPKGAGQITLGSSAPGRVPSAESTGTGAELAAVTAVLTDLQYASFAANAEHCGYLAVDASGTIVVTQINQGTEASCTLPRPPAGVALLASFHTHGTYSPEYASEFPTSTDMLTDANDAIDGYISTPGGRLWYVDTDTMTARQLCGRGCLPQDPNYRPEDDGPLQPVFTLQDLTRIEGGYARF